MTILVSTGTGYVQVPLIDLDLRFNIDVTEIVINSKPMLGLTVEVNVVTEGDQKVPGTPNGAPFGTIKMANKAMIIVLRNSKESTLVISQRIGTKNKSNTYGPTVEGPMTIIDVAITIT